jgi:hypothetical protein
MGWMDGFRRSELGSIPEIEVSNGKRGIWFNHSNGELTNHGSRAATSASGMRDFRLEVSRVRALVRGIRKMNSSSSMGERATN